MDEKLYWDLAYQQNIKHSLWDILIGYRYTPFESNGEEFFSQELSFRYVNKKVQIIITL